MAKKKFYVSMPGCESSKCPYYVNNRGDANPVHRANGRTLYWGERYCLYGKRARQFPKSAGTRASWCPRIIRNPQIRIYTRRPSTYFEDKFSLGVYSPEPKDYYLCRTTSTMLTPLQFCKKLCRRDTNYNDLLRWEPALYDVIEIDVGLTKFYVWLSSEGWNQVDFDPAKADCGEFGDFILLPHQELDPERYNKENALSELCTGYVNGYFAGGLFRSQWIANPDSNEGGEAAQELDDLLHALQTYGFLKSLPEMESYCLSRWWARLEHDVVPGGEHLYGFRCDADHHTFYLLLAPIEDSPFNVQIFCYQVPEK